MPGPQNAIMGDDSFGTNMPQTQIPEDAMDEIVKTAKFSKTAEFKELKKHLEGRIGFYRSNLPGGQPVGQVDPAVVGPMWIACDTIIREFQGIIDVYESAAQTLKDAKKNEPTG